MAYDKDKRKLYTTTDSSGKKIGISLWEIYDCLRYNKVDQRGNRNLGMVIKNGNINLDSLFRPYKTSKPTLGEGVFKSGGEDGLYGYVIPYTENSTVTDLWGKTWSHKARPDQYYKQDMFDGYWHLASFDTYPFGIVKYEAGEKWAFDFKTDMDHPLSVSPSHMEIFKTYYPAFQVFEEDYNGIPKTTPIYNWCGSIPVGNGISGTAPIDFGLEDDKTYYIIPFLSQYKFTSQAGYMGTLNGKKYCLIYKDFKVSDWTIGKVVEEIIYKVAFGSLNLQSNYAASFDITLSSQENTYTAYLYAGFRIYDEINGIESIWYDAWNPSQNLGEILVEPNNPVTKNVLLSWGGQPLTQNAKRIEVQIYDPAKNQRWYHEYDL